MRYQFASVADLAADEFFARWVVSPTAESDAFWQNWLLQYPSKREEVEQARRLVSLLCDDLYPYRASDEEAIWQRLQKEVQQEQAATEPKVMAINNWRQKRYYLSMAASVALILLVSSLFLLRQAPVKYSTGYGEQLSVQLPDGSRVVLNGNSALTYTNDWPGLSDRKVDLQGEAFFEVVHKGIAQPFVVRAADDTEVKVLGTAFNVTSRNHTSRVVLASGKVQLTYTSNGAPSQLSMQPGELVEVSQGGSHVLQQQVSPEVYTAWKDGKVIFDNTSLQDIADMLEQVYGYKVVIADAELARQRLTASLKGQGVDKILATVSATLGTKVTVQKESKTILISIS